MLGFVRVRVRVRVLFLSNTSLFVILLRISDFSVRKRSFFLPPAPGAEMEEDATSTCMSAPADWAAALAGWSVADTVAWLHSLPPALQQQLHARLPVGGGPPPPPWDAAAGSVPDLLTELGSALKPYAATLAEYEYERVAQLQALGRDGLREELRGLGVTWDHRDKLCSLAFSPRPCGSLGGAFSRAFLEAARPLHAAHMGCENMVRVRVRVRVSVSVSVRVRVRVRS